MKAVVQNAFSDRMKVIWYNWVAIQVMVFCYFICACAGAADAASKGYGFVAVWSMLMSVAYSAGGTLVLRRIDYRTPLAVGFLIGVGAVMANVMLLVAAVSGANLAKFGVDPLPSSEKAVQAFAVMLFMSYATFTAFVTLWRDILLPPPMAGQDHEAGLPPPQASFGGSYGDAGYGANAPAGGDEAAYDDKAAGGAPAVL